VRKEYVVEREEQLRLQLEETKVQLLDQGCQTVRDAIKRDEEAFVRLVDVSLELGFGWSDDVLLLAREIKLRIEEEVSL
jgi:hypothetical protein